MRTESVYFEDHETGQRRTTSGRTITETDIVVHAGHTGDFFPHHVDAAWAAKSEFGQRIAHGTLVFAVSAGLTADHVNPVAFSYGYDRLRFVAPVHIGDTIHVETEITGTRDDPKRPGRGFVDELNTVRKQDGSTAMVFTHVYSVERRDGTAADGTRGGVAQ